jgi:hypothetical protein
LQGGPATPLELIVGCAACVQELHWGVSTPGGGVAVNVAGLHWPGISCVHNAEPGVAHKSGWQFRTGRVWSNRWAPSG